MIVGDCMNASEVLAMYEKIEGESEAAKAAAEAAADALSCMMEDASCPQYVRHRAAQTYVSACGIMSREIDRLERLARRRERICAAGDRRPSAFKKVDLPPHPIFQV